MTRRRPLPAVFGCFTSCFIPLHTVPRLQKQTGRMSGRFA
ncbi:hypothetical protein C7S15_1549 [Burkholderia cepacia]|nr:hypothetical protein [Burkholderia cepacia]